MRTSPAIAVGAVVQAVAIALYMLADPELGDHFVLLGFVGGLCGALLVDLSRGVWVEGAGAAVAGCCLYLLGLIAWGGYQAVTIGGRLGEYLFAVSLSTAITHALMLLTPFAIEGLIAGALVGWLKRSNTLDTGRDRLRNVIRR